MPPGAALNAGSTTPATQAAKDKDKKAQDSLFGPNIGVVNTGPAWTIANEKKVLTDELTQDVVQHWIEKSKESSQPATTLQALVNLKRPTLRLSPLAPAEDAPESSNSRPHHHHGLEFEYDCDSAKCGIYVHVLLPQNHPDAGPSSSTATGLTKFLVFESVVDGGFGRLLKLEEGAVLELERFENGAPAVSINPNASTTSVPATNTDSPAAGNSSTSPEEGSRNPRRRFTHFNFRKRPHNRPAAGPALAIVDAQPTPVDSSSEDPDKEGVRVTIRLAALDENGTELSAPNEQLTYLHVIRFGAKPAAASASSAQLAVPASGDNASSPVQQDGEAEDTRPWVVKVVKREATIGPHTFHLHEIYGLSAASTNVPAATAPLPTADDHTYPPATPATASVPLMHNQPVAPTDDNEPSSECLLCLSSPREVVLLPCRHLVACKECALNMIEFGAGGNITQASEAVPAAEAGEAETSPNPDAPAPDVAVPTPEAPAPAPAAPRRKRKAKGWFCPVCRQPYTSLLRITTTPPPAPPEPPKEETAGEVVAPEADDSGAQRGILASAFRPGFLRGLSTRNAAPASDLERQ
ncbi:hypothetical protein C8J56DRAFT_536251 [Mycena floridula]|nr:hypothetical protein C8J56DRAFT_536251 [Mycena floridula]